ncbi:hypothetical protein ACI6PS_12780 [Flavobacterium sp. PLA-1-15]|uniref:hypothetical protein n=1 Tax=Flavobacterium sp. PLA-1-15 TaxID=3380533 RepID=UPI003B7D42CD
MENSVSSNSVGNPLGNNLNVVVTVPHTVKVKLVDASLLNEFEVWMYFSGILLNAVTGFWVSYVQNTVRETDKVLWWISLILTILFAFTSGVAINRRIKMNKNSKDIELNTSVNNPLL